MAKRTLRQEIYYFLRKCKKRTVREVRIDSLCCYVQIDMGTDWGSSDFAINVLEPLVAHLEKKGWQIASSSYNSFSVEIELE